MRSWRSPPLSTERPRGSDVDWRDHDGHHANIPETVDGASGVEDSVAYASRPHAVPPVVTSKMREWGATCRHAPS